MHRAAYHFIKALGIPALMKTKKTLQTRAAKNNGDVEDEDAQEEDAQEEDAQEEEEEEEEDEADIDVSMDLEASADDLEAMAATTVVDFDPGDTLGKILALVNQIRMSSDGVREYLAHACAMSNLKAIELLLWVRSRWGSLSHCLESTLKVQKVCSPLSLLFVALFNICEQAIDYFCVTADANEDLPPLSKNKSWLDYRLTPAEWKLIKLAFNCLKVCFHYRLFYYCLIYLVGCF